MFQPQYEKRQTHTPRLPMHNGKGWEKWQKEGRFYAPCLLPACLKRRRILIRDAAYNAGDRVLSTCAFSTNKQWKG